MTESTIQDAMSIILHSGDARVACTNALKAIEEGLFLEAENQIQEASAEITKAHKIHTDAIQNEAAGEDKSEYSLLFAHAQDTLMTIMSEINIAKQLIKIFKSYDDRLKKLEDK